MRRETNPVVVFDTGNFIARRKSSYGYDTPITLQSLQRMGYDAVGIGDKEISWGLDELEVELETHDIHPVSNNLIDAETGEPRFETYRIVRAGRLKVGVTSTIGGSAVIPSTLQEREKIRLDDIVIASREALRRMEEEKADLKVLLAHTGLEKAQELVDSLPGYDLILVGHDGRIIDEPKKEKGVILAATKTRSNWFGEVTLVVDNGTIQNFSGRSWELKQDDGPVDPFLKEVTYTKLELDEQGNRVATKPEGFPKAEQSRAAEPEPAREIAAAFLGGEKCALCHGEIHEHWTKTAHASAFKTIAEGEERENPECWKCHVVGLGEKTGHPTTALEPNLWNVQCESCHGMGTDHVRGASRKKVDKSVCLGCHTEEWSPDFDYDKYLKEITCSAALRHPTG
ncbi:MAG: hypothetical protein EHM19_02385 [Candidatus Latescibacterota bacterium]|nr:MAG: hypothetical protein EHM19_02385 [Candidatus Latescibacterota bacterium]